MRLDILVVDDIRASRQALCALVNELGHQAIAVDSGEDALARVQQRRPDLVLLDLLMPRLDGFEVTRRLREREDARWLPVIVTSSLQGEEHFIRALHSGADDYLSRPVNAALLDAKLRHYSRVLALQAGLSGLARRQRDILDNILDAVVTLDAQGRVRELNRAARALFAPKGDALGQPCETVLGAGLAALLGGRSCRLRRADGAEFEAEVSPSQWHEAAADPGTADADADGVRHTLVLRDLTARRQVERMKDEFLATVSHELRTPLTSVLGALGLLAGGAAGPLPAAAAPLAEVAQRNGERLSRLIDDILDLTKLEGDKLVLQRRVQPVAPLLREALAAIQGYAGRSGVQVLVDGLDGAAAGVTLPLDADRFLQVLANLLSNAIKHTPTGGQVRLTLTARPEEVQVRVLDQGPGIAPAFRAHMFEKFSQAEGGDRRAQGGTGLGLYISRMLVERMGGQISADDLPPGQGAAFSLRFARVRAERPRESPER